MPMLLEETWIRHANAHPLCLGEFAHDTYWSEAVSLFLQKQPLSDELVFQLIEECHALPVNMQEEYLGFCRKFLALLLLCPYSETTSVEIKQKYHSLYVKLIHHQHPQQWQLGAFYQHLIGAYLNKELTPLHLHLTPSGLALTEYGGQHAEQHLPQFLYNVELALLAGLLALLTQHTPLLEQVVHMSLALAAFVEPERGFPEGLWTREEEFKPVELTFLSTLLFHLVSVIAPCDQIMRAYPIMNALVQTLPVHTICIIYPLLSACIDKWISSPLNFSLALPKDFEISRVKACKYLGYTTYQWKDLSCYCTVSGAATGFAGFSKGLVRITSVGPHTAPLGEMRRYGIYRTPLMQQTPFKEVVIDKQENKLFFSGWTGVVAGESTLPKPGPSWLYIQLNVQDNKALLTTKWLTLHQDSRDVLMTFFVKGKKAIVDKNYHLYPDTLDRYHGKAAEIVFQDSTSSLKIKTQSPYSMQVIPLAGESYFWGAQFLVAYSFPQEESLLFEIS